jgi:hypothetical protein
VLYVLIGLLAVRGGIAALRTEAVLQTLLVFLGFNVAWLLLLDDKKPARPPVALRQDGIITPCGSSRTPEPTRRRTAATRTTGSCTWTAMT